MRSPRSAAVLALSIALTAGTCAPSTAADVAKGNVVPDYEIKLLIDPAKTLTADHKLTAEVRDALKITDAPGSETFQYFDTNDRQLDKQGWVARIRRKNDDDKFKLTYKKRYTVTNGDVNAAADKANREGFDSGDTNYAAQVNWGYSKQTLDLSNDKKASAKGYDSMPGNSDSRDILLDDLPGKLADWSAKNWGVDRVKQGRVYGPVTAATYAGSQNGTDIDVEVLPLKSGSGFEYLVEVSEKAKNHDAAQQQRNALQKLLTDRKWLLAKDEDKTSAVLDRY